MRVLCKFMAGVFLILMACSVVYAQTTPKKPDVIQKLDNTKLEVIIDEINKTDILYRKPGDPKGPLYALPKKDVLKIIWNNGDIENVTTPPQPVQKPANPITLLKKKEKPILLFWDHKGVFGGLRLGAGAGMAATPMAPSLTTNITPTYNGGATLGYRLKALSVEVEALYSATTYSLHVPANVPEVTNAVGQQQNLVVPLTATLATRLGKVRVGITVGGFGAMQVGNGSTLITNSENIKINSRNCAECTDQITYGAVGGLMATVFEKAGYAVFLDARWYHTLANNKEYKVAESGVKMHTGVVGIGVLFNLSGK